MRRTTLCGSAFALLVATAGPVPAQVSSSSTSRFVSPTVVASWIARTRGDHTDTLLVLWRGSAGWFAKTGVANGAASWSSGGSGRELHSVRAGGREFTLEFFDDRRVVRILDEEIPLTETNTVLVDGADSRSGPVIVDRRWIAVGPPLPPMAPGGAPDQVAGIISRSPALVEYLQCGVPMPDARMSAIVDLVCRRMRGETVSVPGLPPR